MKHNKSIYKIGTLALMLLASGGTGYAQKKQQKVKENVSIQVVDKSGKAIPGAEIVVGEVQSTCRPTKEDSCLLKVMPLIGCLFLNQDILL